MAFKDFLDSLSGRNARREKLKKKIEFLKQERDRLAMEESKARTERLNAILVETLAREMKDLKEQNSKILDSYADLVRMLASYDRGNKIIMKSLDQERRKAFPVINFDDEE